jgi:PAS domain S-box-containing protein
MDSQSKKSIAALHKDLLILVVDDSATQRLAVGAMLESAGYQVVAAEDGAQALVLLKERAPALIILDVIMPDMDGFSLCAHIRDLPDGKNIPILMITAHDEEKIVEQAFEAGADDFIRKPITWPVLRLRLLNLLKVKQAERNFQNLAQSAVDGIIIIDLHGIVRYFNPAAETLFGYEALEIEGQNLSLLIPESFRGRHLAGIERYIKTRRPRVIGKTVELVGLHSNGTEFPMELSLSVTENAGEINFTGIIRDISERDQSRKELEANNRFLESILSSLSHPFYVINVSDYSIQIANPAARQLSETGATTCYALTHQEEKPCGSSEHRCPLEEVKRTKKPAHFEHVHFDENNEPRYVDIHAFPIFDQQGNVVQVIEYSLDITEKKNLELAVGSEKVYLERVLDSAPDAIVTLDSQHNVRSWNPGAEKLFGYSEGEAVGQNLDGLITGKDPEIIGQANRLTRQVLAGGAVPQTEAIRQHKDGSAVQIIMSGSPIFERDNLVGAVAIYTDISQRLQAEDIIRKSQARYIQIFQNAGAAIWVEDFSAVKTAIEELKAQGIADFSAYLDEHPEFLTRVVQLIKVRDVNQAVLDMLCAKSKGELLGALDKVVVPETQEIMRAEFLAIANGDRYFEGETVNQTLDGDLINVLTKINFPENQDEFDNVLVSMMDITERVNLELETQIRAGLMAQLASMGGLLNRPVVEMEVIETIGEGGYNLSGASGAAIFLQTSENEMTCPWSKNLPIEIIDQGAPAFIKEETPGINIFHLNDPLLIPHLVELPQDILISQWVLIEDYQSAGFWPLVYEGQVVAVVVCFYKESHVWTPTEQEVLLAFSRQASTALMNARLFQETQGQAEELYTINLELQTMNATLEERVRKRTYELQVLHELSQEISYTLEYDELFRRLLSHLHRIVDYDVAVCLLVLDGRPIVYQRKARPFVQSVQEEIRTRLVNTFDRMQGMQDTDWSAITVQELELLEIHQTAEENQIVADVKALNSTFQVPLIERTSKKMIGLLFIGAEHKEAFSEEIVRTLYTLSNQASVLLERLRALMDVEQQRLKSLVDRIPEGVILLDKERKVILVNPTGQDLLSRLSSIRQGEFLSELGGQEIDLLLQQRADGQPHEITVNTGQHQVLEVEGRQIESGPEAGGWALAIRDITWERDLLNAEQTRRKELDTLYRLSRELTATDDYDEVLQTISQYAVEIINISFSRVILYENDQGFRCQAAYPIRVIAHDLGKGQFEPESIWPVYQRVLALKEPVLFESGDSGYPTEIHDCAYYQDVQILCMVPLRIGDEALGLLVFGETRSSQREPFDDNKVRLSSAIGDQAASAIHRAMLNKKTQQSLRRMTALRQIDMAIASSVDLNINLSVVLNQITSQLDVDAANILILNANQQKLEYASSSGFRTKAINHLSINLGQGFAGQAALQQNTVYVPDLKKETPDGSYAKVIAGEDFYSYYGVPFVIKGKIKGVLEIYHRSPLHNDSDWLDYLKTLAGQTAIAIDSAEMFTDLQRSNIELRMAYDATIEGWARALEYRDLETEGHSRRVVDLTVRMAGEMGIPPEEIIHVRRGALLHDIGKMGIPDSILKKKGPLNEDEWGLMHQHPEFAKDMLGQVVFLSSSLDIPYCHHERWDGTGYPQGLQGQQIPLSARIFAVVDVWDALRSDRPYRDAWPLEKTLAHIKEQSGKHFDPQVVDVFIAAQQDSLGEARPLILIVDDDEELVNNLAEELADEYKVFTAYTGEAALTLIEHSEIEVLLTDHYMPQMTGIQLLTQVYKVKPSVMGILISGFIDQDILSRAINLGNVRGFISKPVKVEDIRKRLKEALKEKRPDSKIP